MTDDILMVHKPSNIELANKYFNGYLTEEELQERQYSGRRWVLAKQQRHSYILYIVVDDETVIEVRIIYGILKEFILQGKEMYNFIINIL